MMTENELLPLRDAVRKRMEAVLSDGEGCHDFDHTLRVLKNARLHNTEEEALNSKEYSRNDTAYREYLVKLRHVPERQTTRSGRRHAQEREKFMHEFFRRMIAGE